MKRIVIAAALLLITLASSAQIKVVGHRGVRFNTPFEPETPYYENTIPALEYNQSLGIYGAEFDVQLTADEKIIVFHGPKVPGLGKSIHTLTFDQARAVVLPGGSHMPTLEEYFEQARKHPETKIILEIKVQSSRERETKAVELVMETVRKMNMQSQIEYTTFSDWMVQEIHRIDPKAKVLFLESGVFVHDPDYCYARGYNAISYDMNGLMNHPDYVERAHQLGMEVTLWIVNDNEVVDWAIRHGVDYVSSDHPERIKEYLDSLK
ncbi:MAG: glycerophosphodiester phosphodiesterase [Bacteroidales bacterium]|nr:glycerophosphodiester phosphodiesterase [Bacteroidales bacterium]MBQ6822979.1 glycerophosphodiester phosphodiesterase [Bacteroidales bacterium]